MSKSNKDPHKHKKCCPKLRSREEDKYMVRELLEAMEFLFEDDCKKKSKKKSKEKSCGRERRECPREKSKKAKNKQSSSEEEGAWGGVIEDEGAWGGIIKDEPRNELEVTYRIGTRDEGPDDGDDRGPRPGCSRDPASQASRRKRRLQRRPPERPNDSSSSSPCSPQQRQKSRGKKPSPQKCAQNEANNSTFLVRRSPIKEQCDSNENEADSPCADRPQVQRLRMRLIGMVRDEKPNVQQQVMRVIRMLKLDELERFDRKTRGQSAFTKAQCKQFMRMHDEWQNNIKFKTFVARSIKGPVADYWDRRHEQTQLESDDSQAAVAAAAAETMTTSLLDQTLSPVAAGGYSSGSGEWQSPTRPQLRARRRREPGARRKIASSESDSEKEEAQARVRPRRRRPRSRDDDGAP